MPGVELMARPKGRPKGKAAAGQDRVTIINLKGTTDQAEWLEAVHRKTHIAKTVIVRLALAEWAQRNGHPPFPTSDDDQ
jgi:hypothetical protein